MALKICTIFPYTLPGNKRVSHSRQPHGKICKKIGTDLFNLTYNHIIMHSSKPEYGTLKRGISYLFLLNRNVETDFRTVIIVVLLAFFIFYSWFFADKISSESGSNVDW
jgi:hypothetical protein